MFAKKAKMPEAKPEQKAAVENKPAAKSEDLMNDKELVAVITAAIYAASADAVTGAVSKDKLVVRSIRRAR